MVRIYYLGFGAEVGISTNMIHARGPMGLEELTIYKYVLIGKGHGVRDFGIGKKRYTHKREEVKLDEYFDFEKLT